MLRSSAARTAAALAFACASAAASAPAGAGVARFGVAVPTMGITFGGSWVTAYRNFSSPSVMRDIAGTLKADFVRTGWIPDWVRTEKKTWHREDLVMDAACRNGLGVMILIPGVRDDSLGEDDLQASVTTFFARYTQRDPGCLQYAEVGNETDLSVNGFAAVDDYAAYVRRIAPVVTSFGVPVITAGTSGLDVPWTSSLAQRLRDTSPPLSIAGFGLHPYGISPGRLPTAVDSARRAAGGAAVYVTEYGAMNAGDLYDGIVGLAPLTPALVIYEYAAQPNETQDAGYALREHPALYDAARRAFARARGR